MSIDQIGIIGSGRMGAELFWYLLDFGYKIRWLCRGEDKSAVLRENFSRRIRRYLKIGRIDEITASNYLGNIIINHDFSILAGCDLIIEAIAEDAEVKAQVFSSIDKAVKDRCIFASVSSSIIPEKIFRGLSHEQFSLGLHFFYPISLKKIVEVALPDISRNIKNSVCGFLGSIGFGAFITSEANAFVLNRILAEIQECSAHLFLANILTPVQIDAAAVKIIPDGIFRAVDSIGIDLVLSSVKNYSENFYIKGRYPKLIKLLEDHVRHGFLGKKSGRGFYEYDIKTVNDGLSSGSSSLTDEYSGLISAVFVNSFLRAVEDEGFNLEELNSAVKDAYLSEYGPLEIFSNMGRDRILIALDGMDSIAGHDFILRAKALS